jgi:hypothetical protein
MGARRIRREQRREDMAASRRRNGPRKVKERARRQKRMLELIQASKMPYTPVVLSWLSVELDKPSRQITQADVDGLVRNYAGAQAQTQA